MIAADVRDFLVRTTALEPALLEGAGFESLVAERIRIVCGGNQSAYLETLRCSSEECDRLIAGVAVGETWLFRYPRSFDVLVDLLRRRLTEGRSRVRMASIGCATGQEPYCMGIAALHAGWRPEQVVIDAVDRNPEALRAAAAGLYGATSIRGEVPGWAAPHLRPEGEGVRVDPAVRGMVRFVQDDVLAWQASAGLCDAVLCRNVLIYLNSEARARLLRSLCDALAPGGLLLVGHAENIVRGFPLRSLSVAHAFAFERIESIPPETRFAAPKPIPAAPMLAASIRTHAATLMIEPSPAAASAVTSSSNDMMEEAKDHADAGRSRESQALLRLLLERHGPSAAALELLGLLGMASGDGAGARRLFEQAIYLEPARPASLLQLAMICERAGDAARATTYWERARRASRSTEREQPT